jgi:hypothetical protein
MRNWITLGLTAAVIAASAQAAPLPKHVGQCSTTRIKDVETRLQEADNTPVPDSGSAVVFVNGGYQVSYETIGAITHSRAGDPVRMCLVTIPHPCPRGDNRGRIYKTTNLRSHRSWTLPDSEHSCGGA